MKPFIQIAFPSGHLYEIATDVVALDRAKTMQGLHGDEFPTLDSALEDTNDLFKEDANEIQDWARNNMNWSELAPQARLIRFAPPEVDHVNDCEWSYHDMPGMLGELDGDTIMRQPIEMVLNTMALSQQLCNVTVLNGEDGKPYAALALIIGNEHVVGTYLQAMQLIGNSLTAAQQDKPLN
jgi:hypothetical protein